VVARRLFLLLGTLLVTVTLAAQATSAEYRIKAVFLFNFVQFVQWPANAFANERAPIEICVLGDDPFGDVLDQTVAGESVGGHGLVVRREQDADGLRSCHLLFVSRSEKPRLDQVMRAIGASSSVLTVSDIDGFVGRGGAIGFFLDRNRVRFEISPIHARGLRVSSQLLSLGRVLDTNGPEQKP
jgi:hypothetical protein